MSMDAGACKWERWWRQLVEDTTDGMECLDACDSYAHDEACPATNPLVAWRRLRERALAAEARADVLAEHLESLQRGSMPEARP